jgi:hypothetical protein
MAEAEGISLDNLRVLAEQVGLSLTGTELEQLKSMYDFYRQDVQSLHDIDLDMGDLAVVFPPQWDPEG